MELYMIVFSKIGMRLVRMISLSTEMVCSRVGENLAYIIDH